MHKIERQKILLDFLKQKTFYNMNDVKDYMNSHHVPYITLRRDLKELEEQGIINLSYGGINVLNNINQNEETRQTKANLNTNLKNTLAKTAQQLVKENDVIFVGAGTTCEAFVKLITKEVKVITNSWYVYKLARENCYINEVILLGGKYRDQSGAFIGSFTEKTLKIENFSKSFISVNAIDFNGNLYNNNEQESHLETLALNSAHAKVILADSTKFNVIGYDNFYHAKDVDWIITDQTVAIVEELQPKIKY
ncbi:DeoR/GlpR family DNA-binding transcription regulator [Spiroplasma chrysopicola]|uniref:Lactose phosphotransferase system repressor n=1 Tax=Spiroplasma chrysopicola DF-1 TaxID=1276227 RepID=R4UBE1_9MOLU|nr:DeoR/GlpR family DNA-binding transcription regulator [Spiroplasma chrysopicola]AGM25204.1 DeoR family transcriptional regulator, lactose phosphotransferase system repressor [Spiroplasma chrysopicola DF-1]